MAAIPLERAIEEYLTYLRVERGLSSSTLRAYRGDLADFANSRAVRGSWAAGPDAARTHLADRTRRASGGGERGTTRGERSLAPTSLRRRAASIRGFYRFAYGDGLIDRDVAAHIDLPRQPRLLPETLTVAEVEALLEAAPDLRARALLELLYAAGLRVSEALGLDREDLSTDGGFVRVIGKGDKERLVPVGEIALDWLARWLEEAGLGCSRCTMSTGVRGGPCSWATAAASRAAGLRDRPVAARQAGLPEAGLAAHAAALVRDPPARRRGRPSDRPGVARPCEYLHDPALHARHRRARPRDYARAHPRA